MNLKVFIFLTPVVALFLSACAGPTMVVVQSPPTGDSTFTVIPAAYNADEINFAAKVESQLIKFVHLLERPPFKFMKSDQQLTQSSAVGGSGWAAGASISEPVKVTDVVAMYSDSKAAYIVTSYASTRRIRIVDRASNAVVGVIDIPEDNSNEPVAFENRIYSGLVVHFS